MVEVPLWAIAAFGTFTTCLLAIVGYLLRSVISSIQEQGKQVATQLAAISAELASVDKRFLQEQLAQTQRFVDKEGWTRDYVTLTNRIDGLHRRMDRVEREVVVMGGSRRPMRSRSDPGFEPPKSG